MSSTTTPHANAIPTMTIYACGGAGQNIGKKLIPYEAKFKSGLKVKVVFCDTSRSNLDPVIPESRIMLIPGVNGSGGKRITNRQAIADAVPALLEQHEPGDVNIVLHTASGASGSVFGPEIASAIFARGRVAVPVLIGAMDTDTSLLNTKNTFLSYENISRIRKMPVCVAYRENGVTGTRSVVDNEIINIILVLAIFFNGKNRELDLEDVLNFFRYHIVTKYEIGLVNLEFFFDKLTPPKSHPVFTVASLTPGEDEPELDFRVAYHASGFIDSSLKEYFGAELPFFMATLDGVFSVVLERLKKQEAEDKERVKATVKSRLSDDSGSTTEDGLTFEE